MVQAPYQVVDINDEELAIVCPFNDEVCTHEACYDAHVCLKTGDKVLPERK